MRAAKPRVALPLAAAMSEVYERALLLRLAQGEVSGDVLAQEAGLTRAAVWKRIAALRDAGIRIDAVPGRGYTFGIRWNCLIPHAFVRDCRWHANSS